MTDALVLAVYSKRVLVHWLAGWSWTLTLFANSAITPLIGMAIWTRAVPGRTDVVTYYAAMLVIVSATNVVAVHTFSGQIYTGELTDALLRPHSPILATLAWENGTRACNMVFTLPLIVVLAVLTPANVSVAAAGLAVPATLLAGSVSFAFFFALAASAFWTQRYFAIADAGWSLVFLAGGAAAPIPLLPAGVRPWAAALPFRSMRGFPAEVAAGLVHGRALAIGFAFQLIWLVVLGTVARAVWRAGIRRYTALGG